MNLKLFKKNILKINVEMRFEMRSLTMLIQFCLTALNDIDHIRRIFQISLTLIWTVAYM